MGSLISKLQRLEPPYASRTQARTASRIRRAIRDAGGMRCHLCGKQLKIGKLTFDHIIPKSKGGTKARTNMKLACVRCNHQRGTEPVEFFKMKICLYRLYPCVYGEYNEPQAKHRMTVKRDKDQCYQLADAN